MAYGMQGFLGMSAQQSFGTATNSFDYVPIVSETLTTAIEQLLEENIRNRFEESPTREGLLTVAGDIVFEPHPMMLGHFLRGVTGQASGVAAGDATLWQFLPATQDFDTTLCALPPFSMVVHRDVGSSWQLTDAIVNALTLEIAGGTIVRATASMLARVSSLQNPPTPAFLDEEPWTWDAASISIAAAANAEMETLTVNIENNVEGVTLLNATKQHGRYKRNGFRTYGLNGTLDFSDQAQYNIFRAGTQQRVSINLEGAREVSSGFNERLLLDFPQLRYSTFTAGIPGPGRISATFEGNGKFDTTSSYGFEALLVNSKTTYAN